jgi:hypothetical protein
MVYEYIPRTNARTNIFLLYKVDAENKREGQ